jgi:hypothetical protein
MILELVVIELIEMDVDFKKELEIFESTFEHDEVVINKLLVLHLHQILLNFVFILELTHKISHFVHFF